MLRDKINRKESGLVFYSLTPPKVNTEPDKIQGIADKQISRLKGLSIDGLLLYDIQDESTRTEKERTFAFTPTITPEHYSRTYLNDLAVPKIIYKSIANLNQHQFAEWLNTNQDLEYAVFVGASSQQQVQQTNFGLNDAYGVKKTHRDSLVIGGITIPERHTKKKDEHQRIFSKVEQGCQFFISQCVYSINDTKDLLSDYYYTTIDEGREFSPIIFTLAPCGSLKTLQFMEWLGIQVPKWLYNDLKHSKDILGASVHTCINLANEIMEYASRKNIPVGFNIESVSIKKEEIEAANQLLIDTLKLFGKNEINKIDDSGPSTKARIDLAV
jgi:hypothetical protein